MFVNTYKIEAVRYFALVGLFALCFCFAPAVWAQNSDAAAQGKGTATAHSAYEFSKPVNYGSVELSPNGRYVAFLDIKTNKFCLDKYGKMIAQGQRTCKDKKKSYRSKHHAKVYDLEAGKVIKSLPLPENYYLSWMAWGSDERLMMAIYQPTTISDSGRGYSIGGSRIIVVPMADAKIVTLFADQKNLARQNRHLTGVTNLLYSDPEHIIMPANRNDDLDLWKVSLITGRAERIALGRSGTFYWFTDKAGKPILRFDCSGSRCRKIKVYALQGDGDPDDKSAWKKIKTFKIKPDEDEDDFDFQPLAATDVEGQYYVKTNEDDDARSTIKIFDVNTEKYVKTVYEHPRVDVGGAELDLRTGDYAGAWFYEDRLNYKFTDPVLQQHYGSLGVFFKNKSNVDVVGYSADKSKWVVKVTAPNNPGEYFVYDTKTHDALRLFGRRDQLGERLKTTSDIIKIRTRDGKTVTAYHAYPKGAKRQSKLKTTPLLVMPHGGPERRDYYDYDRTVQYFVTRGYQVLQVNFRGSSGFGREFAEAGYGQWGGLMQNDVIDAVQQLYKNGEATAANTCMVGYSYGGYVALYAGAKTPEMFKCIVSGGGVSDILADLKNTRREYGAESESYEYWLESMGDPKKDKAKLAATSPVKMAAQFKAPVLLVHGEYDGIVDFTQSRNMEKALKKAGADVELVKLKDVGHSGWDLETNILYLETVEAFLGKHLKK